MATAYGTTFGNSAQIVSIGTYADAKKKFDTTVPIRGRVKEVRPLGEKRRFTWYSINKNLISVLDDNEPLGRYEITYSCNISDRKIVEFFANGDIKLHFKFWKGPTLFGFLTYVLKGIGTIKSCQGKWYFVNSCNEGFVFDSLDVRRDGMLLTKGEGHDVYTVKDAKPEKKYTLNRKMMNALRNRYAYFIDYGKTCLSMNSVIENLQDCVAIKSVPNTFVKLGLNFANPEILPRRGNYFADSEKAKNARVGLLAGLEHYEKTLDLELLYELLMFVGKSTGRWSWQGMTIRCEPETFLDCFDEVLKYEYRDSLFNSVEQPIGSIFNDKNKKYFNV
jgi:hypothetical protein